MKITLITGATGGLGKALAKLYAQDGNHLLLSGTNEEKLLVMKADFEKNFPSVTVDTFCADLSNPAECAALFRYAQEKEYFVNHLVNNAGFADATDFQDMDVNRQLSMLQVDCAALLYFSRVFLTDMLKNGEGTILNIGSISSFVPGPYMCTYHACKSFVLNLSEGIAHELRNTPIRVLTLCPGPFDSGFFTTAGNSHTCKKLKPITAEKVASYGYKKLKKGKRVAVVGFKNKLLIFCNRFLPRKWSTTISANMLKSRKLQK